MSIESVQAIIGTAITDRQFMHDLLNSKREQVIARFDLTPDERRVVSQIRADSIEQFALQLDNWLTRAEQGIKAPHAIPHYRYNLATIPF